MKRYVLLLQEDAMKSIMDTISESSCLIFPIPSCIRNICQSEKQYTPVGNYGLISVCGITTLTLRGTRETLFKQVSIANTRFLSREK